MKSFVLILCLVLIACSKERSFDEREIRLMSPEKIAGFDPMNVSDMYSGNEAGKVYEGLYEFHPFKRPYELMPNLAEALPTISEDGLTYTFKIKKGVLFHDNACFKDGIGRELKADDFIYSFKRLADPKNRSQGWWVLDDKIVGLNEWRTKYNETEATNYDEEIEGLKKVDDYTFSMKVKRPFPQILYALAMPYTFVVPKEAVVHYGKEFLNHPVGTGAFILEKFDQTNQIIYVKNPKFREKLFPSEGEEGDDKLGLLADAGKKLPLVDKIIVDIVIENQPAWLTFKKAKVDLLQMPLEHIELALVDGKEVIPELKAKGVRYTMNPMLDVTFIAFNHDDPTFKNQKLRQAMSVAYDRAEGNKIFYSNTALEAQSVIPPGLAGFRKEYRNIYTKFDLEFAKKLMVEAGHPNGKGVPEITVQSRNETLERQSIDHFAKCMAKIGIKVKVSVNTWPELIKKKNTRQHQMYTMAWGADYPDAENFLQLLYCPNASPGSNGANYCNPTFDELFKQAAVLQEGNERTTLYEKMNELVGTDVPWIIKYHRTRVYLTQAWLKNFKFMEFNHSQFQYLNVDLEVKKELIKKF